VGGRCFRDGAYSNQDGSLGGIAYLDAEAFEHVADLIGDGEIAPAPRVLAFAEQLVDLVGREQELPRRRLEVLRFQVEEAKREHSLEGGAEDAEGISPDFIVPRDPRQDGERLRCVQVGRDRFVEPLQVAAPGALEPRRR
jgi:hypothetical protein